MIEKLEKEFFTRDIRLVAEELIGKLIVYKKTDGKIEKSRITEIEMYIGEEDLACHAAKGRTARTEVMYAEGGLVYVYLIYGMYWLFNIVTGPKDQAQAILIRGIENINGPGRVGRTLNLDKTYYGEDLTLSERLWIEDDGYKCSFTRHPRINIDYAGEIWKNKPFRYLMK
ncbi:DNA-3-methyladenine glycosylase [Marinifilum flexuosum]|uniref:Putative 3-methyladenine DNA glycosylase n=1 Tax=Marinifilum flexuosum TaxID=1117708 RepID=A0A419X6F5_9BACT|nr:DNA-3-methyladenine glycosylase [Marinifilum flexuosum]RKE03311.1 DNA-3-methyladenine glycosylase [Marinifilum flexuosum]